jgi:hypothetical protein
VFVRIKKAGNLSYLQIVENHREGKSVRQRVIATLAHADEMCEAGKIDALARSFLKYTTTVRVVDAHKEVSIRARCTKALGPSLVFECLWRELGIPQTIDVVRGGEMENRQCHRRRR